MGKFEPYKSTCDRCGFVEARVQEYKIRHFLPCNTEVNFPVAVRYYNHAKQILCDCCIDVFNGQSWGYDNLEEKFGHEHAMRILTKGFNEVPYGFKGLIRRCETIEKLNSRLPK